MHVICWPWNNAIALQETRAEMTQYHIINNWFWLGAVATLDEATTLARMPAGFDHDGYKILCRPVLSGKYDIIELNPESIPASS